MREDPVDERAVEQAIVAIMRRERWLVLERLRRELARAFTMRVGASRLRRILARDPIRTQLICHPANILEPADIHILIWVGD